MHETCSTNRLIFHSAKVRTFPFNKPIKFKLNSNPIRCIQSGQSFVFYSRFCAHSRARVYVLYVYTVIWNTERNLEKPTLGAQVQSQRVKQRFFPRIRMKV